MYINSLILRITMTEKPFAHNKAYTNLKTNFIFHEDLVKYLPKLIKEKGIINIGGKSQSVFSYPFSQHHLTNMITTLPLPLLDWCFRDN